MHHFFDRPGLELFIRVFKIVATGVIVLGFLDTLFGYPVTLRLMGLTQFQSDFRLGLFRANSVLLSENCSGRFALLLQYSFYTPNER